MNKSKKLYKIPILGFLSIIIIGAVLLELPICKQKPIPFLDALFVSTSGTCITGFTPVVISEQFTFIGQLVLLTLIELGALGFMTVIVTIATLAQKKVTVSDAMLFENGDFQAGFKQRARNIVRFTLVIEAIGAILLSFRFVPIFGLAKGIWYSIFHSIAAFCNSGFDILGRASFSGFANDYYVNFVVMALIILGGIGFLVLEDLINAWKKKSIKHLRLQSKIVLVTTAALITIPTIIIKITEPSLNLIQSMFITVNLRTAGFYSTNMANLTQGTKLLSILLMFIGGAPGSTSGGIRIITFAVLILAMLSTLKNRKEVVVFYRKISGAYIMKAITITGLSMFVILIAVITIALTSNLGLEGIIFNCVSAYSTVGLGLISTSVLNSIGKIAIMLLMFVGRVGPMVAFRLFFDTNDEDEDVEHVDGELIL